MTDEEVYRLAKSPTSGHPPWGAGSTRDDFLRAARAIEQAATAPLLEAHGGELAAIKEENERLKARMAGMESALKLALEYWQHRTQRYKNRSPVWVKEAKEALKEPRNEGPSVEATKQPVDERARKAIAAQAAQAVPQGWMLVPVEPTLDMGWAYLDAARADDPGREHIFNWEGYRAALAAAPSAPAAQGEPSEGLECKCPTAGPDYCPRHAP
jgi:hypothetical protein